MAKIKTKEQPCNECGGEGLITKPFYPGGDNAYIRFLDEVCKKCDGVGIIT